MIRFVRDAFIGAVPFYLSEQVMRTIEGDGITAGLIHFIFCIALVEGAVQFIKGWIR